MGSERLTAGQPNPGEPSAGGKMKLVKSFKAGEGGAMFPTFSPDGTLLAAASGQQLVFWNTATGQEVERWTEPTGVSLFAFLDGGKVVALSKGLSPAFHLRDAKSGKEVGTLALAGSPWSRLAVAPGGDVLVTLARDTFTVWDVATRTGRWEKTITGEVHTREVALSHDARTVAVATSDGVIRLYQAGDGKEVGQIGRPPGLGGFVRGFRFSPISPEVAVTDRGESMVRVIQLGQDGAVISLQWKHRPRPTTPTPRDGPELPDRTGAADCVFSPDGKTLAVACHDGNIRLYDTLTWSIRHTAASAVTDRAPQVAFSPDGRHLAVTADGGVIRVFDWRNPDLGTLAVAAPADLERRWVALGSADGAAVYRAVAELAATPEQSVALAARLLQPIKAPDAGTIDPLIAGLDAAEFRAREAATAGLEKLGVAAEARLREAAAAKSGEVRSRAQRLLAKLDRRTNVERLRYARALEFLEYCGSGPAVECLKRVAAGMPGVAETEEAKAALARLGLSKRTAP